MDHGELEKLADGLGQYVRPEWRSCLPGYNSDAEAVAANYIRTLERHSRINPSLVDRVIELHLKTRIGK